MGNCLSKINESVATKYLVEAQDGSPRGWDKERAGSKRNPRRVTTIHPMQCLWVSRGMPYDRPELSSINKRIVSESWLYLRNSMFKIGKVMFHDLFKTLPVIRNIFLKEGAGEVTAINYHVEKVMLTIDRVVNFLDSNEQVEFLMHELGDRHAEHTVRIEYLDCFIPFFIMAIHPALNAKWADSIEEAWAAFFRRIIHFMKENIVF